MEEEKSLMDFLESFEYSIIHPKIFKSLTVYWHHSRCWDLPINPPLGVCILLASLITSLNNYELI